MSVVVKMCGLFQEQDIHCVNTIKPAYVGFVFAPSTRQVTPHKARALRQILHPSIKAVGVFCDVSPNALIEMVELVDSGVIDVIQLHNTSVQEAKSSAVFTQREGVISTLKLRTSAPIFKAVAVESVQSILLQQRSLADMLLLDNVQGGSGEAFAWGHITRAREAGFDRAFFLAGGLNAENLPAALALKPYGIDLSKGLESKGVKDCDKMRTIAKLARNGF